MYIHTQRVSGHCNKLLRAEVTAPTWQSSWSFWMMLWATWCEFRGWCCVRSWTLMFLVIKGPLQLRVFCDSIHKCACMYTFFRKRILHFCVPSPSCKGVERCDGAPSNTGHWRQWRCTVCHQSLVCAGQTSSCSKDRKSFQHNLFGVTSRKLFPTLGFSHRVSGHPSSPLGGSGAPASQSCWSPVCRLCVSMVCTLWDQTLAQTLASRCKHWLSISLLFWFLSLCVLLIYSLFSISPNFVLHS